VHSQCCTQLLDALLRGCRQRLRLRLLLLLLLRGAGL
jgi:hypothetical protein